MPDPKKQHYVPQFLLRNFGSGKSGKERVWVFDKKTKKSFLDSVRSVGHENRFYENLLPNGETLKGEHIAGIFDAHGAKALKGVSSQEKLPLEGEDFVWLSYFTAAQLIRGPNTRNQEDIIRKAIIEKWGPDGYWEGDSRSIG